MQEFFDFRHEYLFDEIITEMPRFDKGQADDFYRRFFDKAGEVLKEEGVIILVSEEMGIIKKYLRLNKKFRLINELPFNSKENINIYIIMKNGVNSMDDFTGIVHNVFLELYTELNLESIELFQMNDEQYGHIVCALPEKKIQEQTINSLHGFLKGKTFKLPVFIRDRAAMYVAVVKDNMTDEDKIEFTEKSLYCRMLLR